MPEIIPSPTPGGGPDSNVRDALTEDVGRGEWTALPVLAPAGHERGSAA
jgi:hypothetical protein